jgi:L-lactate utilization protein LutB
MEKRIEELFANFKKRNIDGFYFEKRNEVHEKILNLIPQFTTVGFSGSQTLEQLEIIEILESRGNVVLNQYNPNLSREESLDMRKKGAMADFYLCSANSIAQTGELVFFSAFGHRIAGIANAGTVIVIAGINKITSGLDTAIIRAREYAAPLNCQRLNWDTPCREDGNCHIDICFAPEYKRMCCEILIIEAEVNADRLKVILINEELGF